jgi:uncharacterized protein (TIGR02757 family)
MIDPDIIDLLNQKADQYNRPSFIPKDPISIPHRFRLRQDIEIMGFWVAVLAWGQRLVILKKATELIQLMDEAPYDFVLNHDERDLERFATFKHRTFNLTDTGYFLRFFQDYYRQHDSLEDAFLPANGGWESETVQPHLEAFHDRFCCLPDFPARTRKHIATPARNSSCKRLLMFLRWMVRRDQNGVDFGLWTRIRPDQLVMPIDVHVGRVSRLLGLLHRQNAGPLQPDWRAALELTQTLRQLDPTDPVRYDFALFGLGVEGEL